jgi:CRP/FNR family transcriptional regulator
MNQTAALRAPLSSDTIIHREGSTAGESRQCRSDARISCNGCRLSGICLPIALESRDLDMLDSIIQRGRPLHKGDHVYRQRQPFGAVYAVRSGALKAYSMTDDGQEQVTGFYLPGEVFGMDGVCHDRYASSAVALETSSICEIPFERLGALSARIPSLQRHFFNLMSQEIAHDQQLITLLGKNSAEQRIAALLLSISSRNARRKLSATAFRLPMSRIDIGNYLGLTVETISRVFNRFQKSGLLKVDQREIVILQPDALHEIVDGTASAR